MYRYDAVDQLIVEERVAQFRGQTQRFLQDGFDAFRHMGGAEHFLATVRQRETALMQRWAGTVEATDGPSARSQSAAWPNPSPSCR